MGVVLLSFMPLPALLRRRRLVLRHDTVIDQLDLADRRLDLQPAAIPTVFTHNHSPGRDRQLTRSSGPDPRPCASGSQRRCDLRELSAPSQRREERRDGLQNIGGCRR